MKNTLTLVAALFSLNASAEWKVKHDLFNESGLTGRANISRALAFVRGFREDMSALNLASPSKLVISNLTVHVAVLEWVNDENCKVPDPGKVELQRSESVFANFYYADKPSEIKRVMSGMSFPMPCQKTSSVATTFQVDD